MEDTTTGTRAEMSMNDIARLIQELRSEVQEVRQYQAMENTAPTPFRLPRRDSFMVGHGDVPQAGGGPATTPQAGGGPAPAFQTSPDTPAVTPMVLHQHQVVPPGMMLNKINLRAIRDLEEFQQIFKNKWNQLESFTRFLAQRVLHALVDEQKRRGTPGSRFLDYTNAILLEDKAIVDMMIAYIRARDTLDNDAFATTLLGSIEPLTSVSETWTFGIHGYHRELNVRLSKHLHDLEKTIGHLYSNATVTDTQNWPPMKYKGGKERYGVIDVLLVTLGRFKGNFEQLIGHDNLKSMTEASSWFAILKRLNTEYCDRSIEYERFNSLSTAPTRLERVQENLSARGQVAETRQLGQRPQTSYQPRILQRSDNRSRQVHVGSDRIASNPTGFNRNRQMPRQYAIEEELEFDVEQSYLSEQSSIGPDVGQRRVRDEPMYQEEDSAYSELDSGFLGALMARHGEQPRPSPQRTLFDPSARRPPNPNDTCYKHFFEGNCPGNCGRSHDMEKILETRDTQWKKFLGSPHVKLDWLENEIKNARRNEAQPQGLPAPRPRNAFLSYEDDTPAGVIRRSDGIQSDSTETNLYRLNSALLDTGASNSSTMTLARVLSGATQISPENSHSSQDSS